MKIKKIISAALILILTAALSVPTAIPAEAATTKANRKTASVTMKYLEDNETDTYKFTYYKDGTLKKVAFTEKLDDEYITDILTFNKKGVLCSEIRTDKQEDGSYYTKTTITYDSKYRILKEIKYVKEIESGIVYEETTTEKYSYTGAVMYPESGSLKKVHKENSKTTGTITKTYSDFSKTDSSVYVSYYDQNGINYSVSASNFYFREDNISEINSLTVPNQIIKKELKENNVDNIVKDSKTKLWKSFLIDYNDGTYMKVAQFTYNTHKEVTSFKTTKLAGADDEKGTLYGTMKFTYVDCSAYKGATIRNNDAKYVVTAAASDSKTGTVTYKAPVKKTKAENVPSTVTINGLKYKVTAISANAFKNDSVVTSVVIGSNLKKIGSCAFYNCKNLKKVTIKTTALTSKNVGRNAFARINSKAVIKVPSTKLSSYKKILKTAVSQSVSFLD